MKVNVEIPILRVDEFNDEMNRMGKRIERFGGSLRCEETGTGAKDYEYVLKKWVDGWWNLLRSKKTVQTKKFEVEADFERIRGWRIVGVASFGSNGLIECRSVYLKNEELIDKMSKNKTKNNNFKCDHCNTDRYRKFLFVLENSEKEIKIVGSNCMKEFIAEDPILIIKNYDNLIKAMKNFYNELSSEKYSEIVETDWASFENCKFEIKKFLSCCLNELKSDVWKDDSVLERSLSDRVMSRYFKNSEGDFDDGAFLKMKEWVDRMKYRKDDAWKMKKIVKEDVIYMKEVNFVVSSFLKMMRETKSAVDGDFKWKEKEKASVDDMSFVSKDAFDKVVETKNGGNLIVKMFRYVFEGERTKFIWETSVNREFEEGAHDCEFTVSKNDVDERMRRIVYMVRPEFHKKEMKFRI